MWQKIKQFFSKKEPEAKKLVITSIKDLEHHIITKTAEFFQDNKETLKNIEEGKIRVKDLLKTLESAELQNPHIPERVKHILKGNKEQFIQKTTRFLDNLTIPQQSAKLSLWFAATKETIKEFSEQTEKGRKVLNEFLANELKVILAEISSIEKCVDDIKEKYHEQKISELNNLPKHIDYYHKTKKSLDEQKKQFQEHEIALQKAEQEYHISLQKKKKIESSDAFEELLEQRDALKLLLRQIKKKKVDMELIFSNITPALKKFSHEQKNKFIDDYMKNPIEALASDTKLAIIETLQKMRKEIQEGSLELTDKRKEQAIQAMQELTREHINKFLKEYGNLRRKETKSLQKINTHPARQEQKNIILLIEKKDVVIQKLAENEPKVNEDKHMQALQTLRMEANNVSINLQL